LIPDGMLGRANAGLAFLSGSVGPIAALTGGALGELVGPRITLGIAAMGIIIASGPILISAR